MCGDLDTSGAEQAITSLQPPLASVVEECESQPALLSSAQLSSAWHSPDHTGAASYICINVKW